VNRSNFCRDRRALAPLLPNSVWAGTRLEPPRRSSRAVPPPSPSAAKTCLCDRAVIATVSEKQTGPHLKLHVVRTFETAHRARAAPYGARGRRDACDCIVIERVLERLPHGDQSSFPPHIFGSSCSVRIAETRFGSDWAGEP